jgi:hypothetical protein
MSRNGSGTYALPAGNPVITGTTISTTWANNTLTDIATALTGSLAADGQTTATGPLNMGTQKITNAGTGTAPTDVAVTSQVTTAVAITGGTIDGTAIGATTPSTGKFTTLQATSDISFTGTGFVLIPSGTTAQRPVSPANGEIRYNTTLNQFEGYANSAWGSLGGGATGGGGDTVFVENSRIVTTNYTLSTGKSAETVGPIQINSGVSVSVPSGQRWVVL